MAASANQTRIITALLLSVVLDYMSFSIALPLIPFYAQTFGASPLTISLLLGIPPVIIFFVTPLWGSLSDHKGYHIALLGSMAGTGLSYLWFGFATCLWMLFISRIIAGLSGSTIAIARAYIARYTHMGDRTQLFSLLQAALGTGFILGLFVTSTLVGSDPDNPQIRLPSYIATATSGLAFGYVWLILPKGKSVPQQPQNSPPWSIPQDLGKILQRPLILELMGIIALRFFVISGGVAISALWAEAQLGWGARQYSAACIGGAVISTVLLATFSKIAPRFQEFDLVVGGFVAMGTALLLLPLSTHPGYLLGVMLLLISGTIMVNPSLFTLMSQVVGFKQQGRTLGMVTSSNNLASFMGAVWSGFLFQTLNLQAPFVAGGFLLLSVALWCRCRINHSRFSTLKQQRRQHKFNYLFDFLDLDQNGLLDQADFEQAVIAIAQLRGWQQNSPEHQTLWYGWVGFGEQLQTQVNLHCGRQLDRQGWLQYLDQHLEAYLNNHSDLDFINAFVQLIDSEQNGRVTIHEFQIFYQAYQLDREEAKVVFPDLEPNLEGYLSPAQLQTLLQQFLYGDDIQAPGNLLFGTKLTQQL
jgi:MFS family permease